MANVEQKLETQKKFIPSQVGIHNKAIDYLGLMQKCINKINALKKVVEGIEADRALIPPFAAPGFHDIRSEAVSRHDNQVYVYRWLLSRYLTHMTKLYTESLYHDMALYPQPDALKNVEAA